MTAPRPSLRQKMEGMAVAFDPSAGAPLHAVLEFAFTGDERGTYQLVIDGGTCRLEPRLLAKPTLRIETDAEVWRAVSDRRLQPIAAVLDGRMMVEGDLGLLQQFPRMFRQATWDALRAPAGQRAPGPVRLPAMAWLFLGLLPWKTFWVVSAFRGPQGALLTAVLLAGGLLAVREVTGGATFLERATALVFAAAGIAAILGGGTPPGIVPASFLALAAIWAASIVHARRPLTAEYSRWGYVPRLWSSILFQHPNALLTLVWAGIFTLLAVLGAAGALGWLPRAISAGLSIVISAAGGVFTRRHVAGARERRIDDPDADLARIRTLARLLLGLIAAVFLAMGGPRTLSGWVLAPVAALAAAALWRAVVRGAGGDREEVQAYPNA